MTPTHSDAERAPVFSLAIFAWNEEAALRCTLRSLLEQTIFERLSCRGQHCEIICVPNGCTDGTARVAEEVFAHARSHHIHAAAMVLRVANIQQRGKVNAWNQFVHRVSAPRARFLFMMDADILIHRRETLENMLATFDSDPEAAVVVDLPRKHIEQNEKTSLVERLSLAASRMTQAASGQLCGQLYSIRADIARKIYLPRDLSACEDGLIKTLVCTDLLTRPSFPGRIRLAPNAEHTFEAYTNPRSVLKNQKRQIIGQTIIHVLIDKYLKGTSPAARQDIAAFLRNKDTTDPDWLKRLIGEHLRATRHPWKLYPDLVGNRFRRLRNLRPLQRLACLPAALAGSGATIAASFMAYRSLKRGSIDYWPKAQRMGFSRNEPKSPDTALDSHPAHLSRAGGVEV